MAGDLRSRHNGHPPPRASQSQMAETGHPADERFRESRASSRTTATATTRWWRSPHWVRSQCHAEQRREVLGVAWLKLSRARPHLPVCLPRCAASSDAEQRSQGRGDLMAGALRFV